MKRTKAYSLLIIVSFFSHFPIANSQTSCVSRYAYLVTPNSLDVSTVKITSAKAEMELMQKIAALAPDIKYADFPKDIRDRMFSRWIEYKDLKTIEFHGTRNNLAKFVIHKKNGTKKIMAVLVPRSQLSAPKEFPKVFLPSLKEDNLTLVAIENIRYSDLPKSILENQLFIAIKKIKTAQGGVLSDQEADHLIALLLDSKFQRKNINQILYEASERGITPPTHELEITTSVAVDQFMAEYPDRVALPAHLAIEQFIKKYPGIVKITSVAPPFEQLDVLGATEPLVVTGMDTNGKTITEAFEVPYERIGSW